MDKKIYRYKKWTHLFQFLDLDQDGVLSFEEFMRLPVTLITSGNVEHGTCVALLYNTMWNKILQESGLVDQLKMDQNTFLDGHDIVSKLQWYKDEFVPGIISHYFDSVDSNSDGKISRMEWEKMYRNQGITDEAFLNAPSAKWIKIMMERSQEPSFDMPLKCFH